MTKYRRWFNIEKLDTKTLQELMRYASSLPSAKIRIVDVDNTMKCDQSTSQLNINEAIELLATTNWYIVRMIIEPYEELDQIVLFMMESKRFDIREVKVYLDLSEDDFFKVVKEFNIEEHQYGD